MQKTVRKAWTEFIQPLLYRPPQVQVAALPVRGKGKDKEVLLITSRGTGRWIIPKGWPMTGKTDAEAAAQEAWEEAGIKARKVSPAPIGSYRYAKSGAGGIVTPMQAMVYLLKVDTLAKKYPEVSERKRKWFSPEEAAQRVDEMGLKDLLLKL
ncbi:MAG: NUDIX hydrolase [Pseudomonadota bacterium]|jgi:8-oxo-dGTP pyrophosphatase MutT (NUDIX family)|uniref:NUDIX domain protein n=1 Tax=Thalassovita autumnalis TaxID=2072972 RepID=A0A0P1F5A1_9RHOB|nr:NUDIX hydrolase [Thalassovita autumnalis]MEC7964853.1 NUDIX hydrolase [Pseudomonadota bacterium]MEC8295601.1 NUDIX hydrolase [Pseudomonadota bacterium]CUH62995.1 NUDIX domain protein [Thalassovita autumnalis]CUH72122.1 NUDIX domain protein [Thalassovita autumnalis]